MNLTLKTIAAACAGAMLLACASSPESPVRPPGRDLGDAGAEQNRRATELAEKADYTGAIALWREMTAAAPDAPETAYLYRNLGYALFLNGEYDASLAALEKACLLDPLNSRGWMHLGSALRKLGQHERADMMFRQANTLERHEFTADYALARGSRVPAIVSAVAAPPRTQPDWAGRELDASSGIVDLRDVVAPTPAEVQVLPPMTLAEPAAPALARGANPADAAAAAQQAVSTVPVDMPSTSATGELAAVSGKPDAVRLEVRNGNGVRGMAAATAKRLASDSMQVVRLTNAKGFGVERTRIEYVSGFQDAASRLAERFSAAKIVKVDNCWKADMRLVIGKDQVSTRPATLSKRRAAAAKGRESASADKVVRTGAPPARG